jgi:hypothetical protein
MVQLFWWLGTRQMNNIVAILIFSVLTIALFYFVYKNFKLKNVFNVAGQLHMQLLIDYSVLENRLKDALKEIENNKLTESDGFIKFISDSRDWAFEYIEEVQKALAEFDEEVAPQLEWANNYGNLAGDTVHTETITKISEAYNKLKSVLPKNDETPNN